MTAVQTTRLKVAAAEVAKGTARGGGSTVSWGLVVWLIFVDKYELLVSNGKPDTLTFVAVGLIALLWTALLRAGERRFPWLATLLLSQGAPTYSGPNNPDPEPEPAPGPALVGGDVHIDQVNVAAGGGPAGSPVDLPPPFEEIPPAFWADQPADQPGLVFAPAPFEDLPVETLTGVAEYAAAVAPDVEVVDDFYEDLNGPHGVNTPEEMGG